MAMLALQPTGAATQPAQEDPNGIEKPADNAADPSGIDSEWIVLGKSDVVSAELAAAAAAAGHRRLGFSPLPMLPSWVQMVLGGLVYTAMPFYKRVRKVEGEAIENVETALEVVEHAAEVTEKLAANVANSLPETGSLHKVAEEVEYIAEEVDKDARKVEVIIKKIEEVSEQSRSTQQWSLSLKSSRRNSSQTQHPMLDQMPRNDHSYKLGGKPQCSQL